MATQHQPTSESNDKPVSDSQIRHMERVTGDAVRSWKGTRAEMQRLKGDPGYIPALHQFWTTRAAMLALFATLLSQLKIITVRALSLFVVKDYFCEDGQPDGIKFLLGANFEKYFVAKVEQPIKRQKFRILQLLRRTTSADILQELGGKEVAVTTLGRMYELIKAQATGEATGPLLVNGYANIFFIEDVTGEVWAVRCRWYSGAREWGLAAFPLSSSDDWDAGRQVFSGDSSVPQAA